MSEELVIVDRCDSCDKEEASCYCNSCCNKLCDECADFCPNHVDPNTRKRAVKTECPACFNECNKSW